MIRFIDLRKAQIAGGRFAFFDTVTDTFITDDMGDQTWDTVGEFTENYRSNEELDRFIKLIPKWAEKVIDQDEGTIPKKYEQSFESLEKAVEFLESPEGESVKGIRLYDGKWYRWEKDDEQFHTGHLRIFLGEKLTTLRVYGDTDKEIGEIREERDKALAELSKYKEYFLNMVGNYEAQIWVSTELGRTVADLQGRLAADGLYHFFHGMACEKAVLNLDHDRRRFEDALIMISQKDCDCVEKTCPACISKRTLEMAVLKPKDYPSGLDVTIGDKTYCIGYWRE